MKKYDDEEQRYIEYFQRCLLTEGSEDFIRAESVRLELLQRKMEGDKFNSQQEKSYLDCYFSEQIFVPLMEKTIALCKQAGIEPKLPVRFANSPGLEPTAATLPSTSTHIVFAGRGTMQFCNCWAKLFAEVFFEAAELSLSDRGWDRTIFREKIKKNSLIHLAASMAIWYALNDTMTGYGKLEREKKFDVLRVLLLNSMEVFVVGHEIAHLSYHEIYPETLGVEPGKSAKDLEMGCDTIGLAVCTVYGIEEENTFATNFIGPLAILYAVQLCDIVKEIIFEKPSVSSETHPTTADRIENVFSFVREAELHPDILRIMHESLEAMQTVGEEVEKLVRNFDDLVNEKV